MLAPVHGFEGVQRVLEQVLGHDQAGSRLFGFFVQVGLFVNRQQSVVDEKAFRHS